MILGTIFATGANAFINNNQENRIQLMEKDIETIYQRLTEIKPSIPVATVAPVEPVDISPLEGKIL